MPEYVNHNSYAVYLVGPDGQTIKIGSGQRRSLSEFFERYVAKGYISRVTLTTNQAPQKRITNRQPAQRQQTTKQSQPARPPRRGFAVQREQSLQKNTARPQKKIVKEPAAKPKIVGRRQVDNAAAILQTSLQQAKYPISNNIGVGILSYNRGYSLARLIDSIRKYTDLRRTTVFISDDGSTDEHTKQYLDNLACSDDFVVLRNDKRLGVAGNANRLMRCLARFRYCLLLNDDVEVLAGGWDSFYKKALAIGAIKHFCMRQPGIYGARQGEQIDINGIAMTRVTDKPHGAVMAYSSDVQERIGYFDERFGIYGMEHVDWSNRVSCAGLQPGGYYDLAGSSSYFVIHGEKSATADREHHLQEARRIFQNTDPARGYVAPSPASAVPMLSCVIPCRNLERHGAIPTVIAGIKAQRFPAIETIVAEHDYVRNISDDAGPFKHILIQSDGRPFNKAKAMNAGVAMANSSYVMLHDADLVLPAGYCKFIYDALQSCDAGHFGKSVLYLTQQKSMLVNQSGLIDDSGCDSVVTYFEGGNIAVRRRTYWLVGGFTEDFWGYGVEDCEFFDRLSHNCNWREDRCYDFIHLWHGRSGSWQHEHEVNKQIGKRLASMSMAQRIQDRYAALRSSGYAEMLDRSLKGII